MGAPAPSNKSARMTRDKTGAIAADRARTAAQKKPGEEYQEKKAAEKERGGAIVTKPPGDSPEEKRKKRLAKMKEITAQARELRMKRSPMPTGPR